MKVRLVPAEKIAIGLALAYLALSLSWAWLHEQLWIAIILIPLLFFVLVLSFALGRAIDAIKSPDLSGSARLREIVAIPLVVGGLWLIDWQTGLGARLSAAMFLAARSPEMKAAQVEAGSGRAAAIPWIDGIPDGGVAIVRYAGGDPASLPPSEHLRLTGERIHRCRRIGSTDYICGYD